MNESFLTNPLEGPAILLLKLDADALLDEDGVSSSRRLKGELEIGVNLSQSNNVRRIELLRFGLYSLGSPESASTRQISIGALSGEGVVQQETSELWSFELRVAAEVTHAQLRRLREPERVSPDHLVFPSELFLGSIDFDVRSADKPNSLGAQKLAEGSINLVRMEPDIGFLSAVSLSFATPALFLSSIAKIEKVVHVRPVQFPLREGGWTGKTWKEQLRHANEIWGKCCICFEPDEFLRKNDPDLAYSTNISEIATTDQEGVIEIFMVNSAITSGGKTIGAGQASAGVVITDLNPGNPHLLAHELGHVLGGQHPNALQKPGRWRGEARTVLKPSGSTSVPNPRRNTASNCHNARRTIQPVVDTRIETDSCSQHPDP